MKCERCSRESAKTIQIKVLIKMMINDRVLKDSRIIEICPECKRPEDIIEKIKKTK